MIKIISALDTFSIRHPVLRAGKTIESCHFDNDNLETTTHFGFFVNKKLVGVASIYKKQNKDFVEMNQYQLRGMAILNNFQNQGIGQKLIAFIENYCKNKDADLIWFNARINAVSFYKKNDFEVFGNSFEIPEIGLHFLMFKHLDVLI